jgi:malate dehydrogenase
VLRSGTAIHGSGSLGELEESVYVVVADFGGVSDRAFSVSEAGRIVSALEKTSRDASILLAIHEPASLLRLIVKSARIDPARVVGTSPEALASLWRHQIGEKLKCSPRRVQASILGAPSRSEGYEVFASLAGCPIDGLLSPAELREISILISRRPHPGLRTLASAAAGILRDMSVDAGAVYSCYVWANGAYGARNLFLCAPAILGSRGVEKILELPLEPRQSVTLSRGLDHLARTLLAILGVFVSWW